MRKVLFCLFLIVLSTTAARRGGGRLREPHRGVPNPDYHSPVYRPPVPTLCLRYLPVPPPPPPHIHAVTVEPTVLNPGATNSKNSSNISIHDEPKTQPQPDKLYPGDRIPGAKPRLPPVPPRNRRPPYRVPAPYPRIPVHKPSCPICHCVDYHCPKVPPHPTPCLCNTSDRHHEQVHQPPWRNSQIDPLPYPPPPGAPPSIYGYGSPYQAQPGYSGGYPPIGCPVTYNDDSMNSQPSHPNYSRSSIQGGGVGSYVPTTMILLSQASSSPGIEQLMKEALVYSTINAGVTRVNDGALHHYHSSNTSSESAGAGSSATSIDDNTMIITNTLKSNYQATPGMNSNLPRKTYVPNNPGTYPPSYPGSLSPNSPEGYVPIVPKIGPPRIHVCRTSPVPKVYAIPRAILPTSNTVMKIGPPVNASTVPNSLNTFSLHSSANNEVPEPNSVNNTDGQNVNSTTETPATAPTYYISEEELKNLTEILFTKEDMYLKKYITLNVQKKSTGNITDQAPQPLMYLSPDLYEMPTIQAFKKMFDNYEFNSTIKENSTEETRREERLLLDAMLNTDTMSTAVKWLTSKYYIESDNFEMRDTLRHIWFSKMGGSTCGFERVFLAELYPENTLIGAQNWLYFHDKESLGDIDYMGYTEMRTIAEKAWLLRIDMKMGDIVKRNSTMLIGISPELEMALYTVCFYVRPNDICRVSLGGNMFYLYTHTVRHFGKDLMDVGLKAF